MSRITKAMPAHALELKLKRELFNTVTMNYTCHFCNTFPKQGPVFVGEDEKISCSRCKADNMPNGLAIPGINALITNLLVACRYKKNGCQFQTDPKAISTHENSCARRDVPCIWTGCDKVFSLAIMLGHVQDQRHKLESYNSNHYIKRNGMKFDVVTDSPIKYLTGNKEDGAANHRVTIGFLRLKEVDDKFVVQLESDRNEQLSLIWVQMAASKSEAANYEYIVQLKSKPGIGSLSYKGPVKSFDDNKDEVFNSKQGLVVLPPVLKKNEEDGDIDLEVEIIYVGPNDEASLAKRKKKNPRKIIITLH